MLTSDRFLLVRYQLDQILAEDDPQDSLNALENLPTDLWEAYTCILERIRGKKGFESAYRIFSWLYHAERPLQMGELVEALSFQNGNTKLNPKLFISVKVILRRCEGLVSYDRMSDEVRFMHFTVFEFLKERCIQNLMKSIEISKVCLKYLFSLTDVLKSDFPSQHERDLLAAFSRKLKKFKFVPYAVHYWDVHGKKEGENELELFEELVAFHETPSMMKAFHSLYLYEKDGVSPLCSLCWTCEGWTVLHLLAMVGLKRICQALFDIASNETPTLPGSLSPLADRVKSMANYCKQNIDKRCLASGSPLHLSALNNDDSVFRLLIHHGADIESTSGNQLLKPVHCAAYSNSESKLALLSSAGADMLHITADGYGPLYYAVQNKECVQFLLGQGAKPSLSGEYLLHTAAKQPDWEILKILIEADPKSINRRNRRGETPLHWAVSGPSDNLKYLLSVPDIELSVQDHDGNTPLHVAASVEHVALLLDAGLDLTITDRFLCTPLDHALIERRTEVARLLFSWTKCVNSARGMERRFDDREFSPVDLLLSRIKDHPCNWNFYSALGATYLSEGDVGMAKQFFDRSYFVRSELKSLDRYFHYCGECTAVSFNHERARYLCFVCEDSDHEVCLDCFPLLQTYHAPRYFNNHHFIRFPSDDYPSSISSFIQEWKENEELYVSIYSQLKP
jgi:ankyrin repeat protein